MSSTITEDAKEQELKDASVKDQAEDKEELQDPDANSDLPVPSLEQEEEIIKKNYGGLLAKKPPLISKDHERAFFDSADWALGKQGAQKPKGPLEALRPKLQPTPQHQMRSRRSVYAPAGNDEGVDNHSSPENCNSEYRNDKNSAPDDQTC